MREKLFVFLLLTFTVFGADVIVMRDGRTVTGSFLGGDARQVRMVVNDKVQTFSIPDITRIEFGASQPAAPPAASAPPETRTDGLQPSRVSNDRPSRGPASADIPGGTTLVVRLIDSVDSETDRLGQTYRASLDEPVVLNGETVVERGADIVAKLVEDQQSGRLTGKTVITLDLVSMKVNGKMLDISTEEVTRSSGSRTARTGKMAGGLAALGAIIGGIAGGGKGAAIGAVTGAGAGGGIQVLTKGEKVRIPSETRLTFILQNPVRL